MQDRILKILTLIISVSMLVNMSVPAYAENSYGAEGTFQEELLQDETVISLDEEGENIGNEDQPTDEISETEDQSMADEQETYISTEEGQGGSETASEDIQDKNVGMTESIVEQENANSEDMDDTDVLENETETSDKKAAPEQEIAENGVYYVDAINGEDSNNGLSAETAWKSLSNVNSITFQPGDQVLLKRGCVWNGGLTLHGSGNSTYPIYLGAYGEGDNPTIIGGEADYKVVSLINESYWEISDLKITSSVKHNNDRRTGIWVENKDHGTIEHIYITNCEVYDIPSKDTNSDVECLFGGISITGYGSGSKYNDVRIENNYVHDLCKGGITTYTYNEDRNIWDASFGYSTNVYIANNTVRNVKGDGIVAKNVDGAIIEYNVCDGAANGGAGSNDTYGCYAGIWGAFCKNTVFRYNEVYNTHRFLPGNNDGMAFDTDINCENVTFEYNYSHDNEGGFYLDMGDAKNSVVRYNISQNDKSRLFMFSSDRNLHLQVYNNVFYIGEGLNTDIQDDDFASPSRDVVYTNNIFYNLGTGEYHTGNAQFINNCFYGNGTKPSGNGNFIADPKLQSPGNAATGIDFTSTQRLNEYWLTETSPCINAGRAVQNNGGRDFWGNSLYYQEPDIGAQESAYETPSQGNQIQINDNDATLAYTGNWTYDTQCSGGYSGDSHFTSDINAKASFVFKGTSVAWMGQKDRNYGIAEVYLDGISQGTVDCYSSENVYQQMLYQKEDLSPGEHVLTIVCTGQKNPSSEDCVIDIDSFFYARCTTDNLVNNSGFESGAGNFWNSYNSASVSNEAVHSGAFAAKVGKNSSYEQNVPVQPNTKYVLQGWIRSENDGSVMTLGVKNYGGNEAFSATDETTYQMVTVTFITGADIDTVTIYGYRQNSGRGSGYFDDVSLFKVADLSDYNALQNAQAPLDIPTYDGTNQPTHPSVVKFEQPWNGYLYWMAMTPYPFNDGSYENPSIVSSNDGITWVVPSGITNPLINTPNVGHNCDVDLVYVPNKDELWMYYVEADDLVSSSVKLIRSSNGVQWSEPVTVLKDWVQKYSILSPSIEILEDGSFMMWYVDTGNTGYTGQNNKVKYRTSDDGISWSSAITCDDLVQPGYQIWHLDVHYDEKTGQFFFFFSAYPKGKNSDYCNLFFAVNKDGKQWNTFSEPIMKPSNQGKWDDFCLYRTSMIIENGNLRVWYGAKKQEDSSWHIGLTERNFQDFLNILEQ